MKIATGIDIVEVKRIKERFEGNNKFKTLIFTANEIEQTKSLEIEYIVLSGKWASKEAFSKALGTGIGDELHWLDMEIKNDINGRPEISVKKEVSDKYKIDSISLSISHTQEYAVASVVLLFND